MNKKIVVLGGGSGLSTLLRGLKHIIDIDISAIVTVFDNGTSSGRLSKQYNIPAVGDLRRVMAVMSLESKTIELLMNFRYENTSSNLDGHTIGNLIIAKMIEKKGNFAKGIEAVSKALNVQGKIVPISNKYYELIALHIDNSITRGEEAIGKSLLPIKMLSIEDGAIATEEAIEAIINADYILFGIGSLYTSLIANLVFANVKKALKKSKAKKIYFGNIFTQKGETDNMTLSDHVKAVEDHTYKNIFDQIIISTTKLSKEIIESYKKDGQDIVVNDVKSAIGKDLVEVCNNSAKHSKIKIIKVMQEILQ